MNRVLRNIATVAFMMSIVCLLLLAVVQNVSAADNNTTGDEGLETWQWGLIIGGIILGVIIIVAIAYYFFKSGGEEGEAGPDAMPGEGGDIATGEEQFLDEGLDQVGGEGMGEGFEAEPGAEGIPGEGAEEGEEEVGEEEGAQEDEEKPEAGEGPEGQAPPPAAAPGEKKDTPPGKKELTLQEKFSFVREKYAKGEITEEQYEQALGVLKDEAEKEHREQIQRRVAAAAKPEPEKKAKKSTGFECANCGGMTPDVRKRCPFCKKEFVPEQAMCPECNNRVPMDAEKCDKCGAAFES